MDDVFKACHGLPGASEGGAPFGALTGAADSLWGFFVKRQKTVVLASLSVAALFLGGAPWGLAADRGTSSAQASQDDATHSGTSPERLEPLRVGSPSPSEVPAPAPMDEAIPGSVIPNADVAEADTVVQPVTVQTADEAVAAFTSLATWFLASPAARKEPARAVDEAGEHLNPADAHQLIGMVRSERDHFAAERGGYRVLGYAGKEATPDQVMVEVVAPLTTRSGTRWAIVGGVVSWRDGQWELTSLRPTELKAQPSQPSRNASSMTSRDQEVVFEGLGWRLFATAQD